MLSQTQAMAFSSSSSSSILTRNYYHIVAMPFPGRGHINPMMNFCKLLVSRRPQILITFVLTEEWLGHIGSDPKPQSIRFETIPNVLPPERLKAVDFPGFYDAVMTKMQAPFEQLLDRLEHPVTVIIGDIETRWAVRVGNRRNIPVAAFWTMSATVLSILYHFHLFIQQTPGTTLDLIEQVESIPGTCSSDVADIRTIFHRDDPRVLQLALDCISRIPEAQFLIFTSFYELEPQVIDRLRQMQYFPIYNIGPSIPYLELNKETPTEELEHMKWLECQRKASVLYISLGSFLSVSSSEMDEIIAGLQIGGVQFLWVARGAAADMQKSCGEMGMVIPWCDQLKVSSHPSVGGFLTHCGWNSVLEALFSGVPMLGCPLFLDQDTNCRKIVDEWRVGWRISGKSGEGNRLGSREDIGEVVRRFMDLESNAGKEMRRRAQEVKDMCAGAISAGGSSSADLDSFIKHILS